MKQLVLSLWIITFTASLAYAEIVSDVRAIYHPELPGVIPDAELKESDIPAERKSDFKPTVEETNAFADLLKRMTSRDYSERVGASRELSRLLTQGTPEARYRWLSFALAAQKDSAVAPEATQHRLPRLTAPTKLANVDWVEAYCRFLAAQLARLKPYADLSDSIVPLFRDTRRIATPRPLLQKIAEIEFAREQADSIKRELEKAKASLPKALQADDPDVKIFTKLHREYLDLLATANEEKTAVKHAQEFHDSVAQVLTKGGFEVEPTFIDTVGSSLSFVVKKGPLKARVVVSPRPKLGRDDDTVSNRFAINVFPLEAKPETATLASFVEPLVALRYDFTKLPPLSLPPLGIGALVAVSRGPVDANKKIPVSGIVSDREIVASSSTPMEAGSFALPASYLAELQPQLNWDRLIDGTPDEKGAALRRAFYLRLFAEREKVFNACGGLKPMKPVTLDAESAVSTDERLLDRIPYAKDDDDEKPPAGVELLQRKVRKGNH